MSELWFMPAHEIARRVRQAELSPVEVVEASLDRIEAVNPELNAFVDLCPEAALAEARGQAERIARGDDPGPLAGLPLGVKDLEDAAGLKTARGSLPFKDYRPGRDSVQVARLRAAGAIVVGKTNVPEFGHTALTKNLVYGVTRNPWNLERTPGGSSGGSAAAIAAGMVPLATGSDGGGSIRIPACFVGAFGLKPNYGRVPIAPREMLHWSDTSVYGPITRSVRDAALYMDAVVGPHPADPDSLPHPGLSYFDSLERFPGPLRMVFNPRLGCPGVERDVLREVMLAVQVFRDLGHHVEEREDALPDMGVEWAILSGNEVYAEIAPQVETHRSQFGRGFLAGVESLKDVSAAALGKIYRLRSRLNDAVGEVFERADLLLTPTLPVEAFPARGPLPAEINGQPLRTPLAAVAFTYPFNLTGHPAATVRAGFTDAGLPCGLQIVAPRHREDLILQAAHAYEGARPWNDRWPR